MHVNDIFQDSQNWAETSSALSFHIIYLITKSTLARQTGSNLSAWLESQICTCQIIKDPKTYSCGTSEATCSRYLGRRQSTNCTTSRDQIPSALWSDSMIFASWAGGNPTEKLPSAFALRNGMSSNSTSLSANNTLMRWKNDLLLFPGWMNLRWLWTSLPSFFF